MSVLYVLASSDLGGSESALMSWMSRLPELGWDTGAVFVQKEGRLAAGLRARGAAVVTGSGGRFRNPVAYGRDIVTLTSLIRRTRPRLVYSSGAKAHLYGGVAAALTRTPAVWFAHDYPGGSGWVRPATRVPGRIYANSEGTAAAYRPLLGRTPGVVYPPTEVERFGLDETARSGFRAELGAGPEETVFGYVGRLQRQKGVETFIAALAAARQSEPRVRGVVVGSALQGMDEAYEGELRHAAASLGLDEAGLRFIAFQPDPRPALCGIDCLVLTPRLPEGFGLSVIEAMAAGRWVIATAEGGPLETVTATTGELVTPRDVDAVTTAILRFAREPKLRRGALSEGPRRSRDFGAAASARLVAAAFAEVVGDPPSI
ncbi:MAG: hypothetical protein QOK05_2971 [Chloroflexota bacterium]|nr:hypothetical protein [Chloroflexota bacterium]